MTDPVPDPTHANAAVPSGAGARGLLVVLAGPSGVGKTTIRQALIERHDGDYIKSISATTRPQRPYEVEGKHYFFLAPEAFEARVADGWFLEHATYLNNCYGTPHTFVEDHLAAGHVLLLDIDVQGADQLAAKPNLPVLRVFIAPPSMSALRERLTARGEEEGSRTRRIERATEEMTWADRFDVVVVNDDLDKTVNDVEHIIEAARNGDFPKRPPIGPTV